MTARRSYANGNPMGYCGIGGTGVSCPVGLGAGTPPAQVQALPPESAPTA